MSTTRLRPIAVAPSRRGLPPIRKMPPASPTRAPRGRAQAAAIRAHYGMIASEPVPARFDLDRLARGARSWRAVAAAAVIVAFLIGGVVGWMAHAASAAAPSRFDTFTAQAL